MTGPRAARVLVAHPGTQHALRLAEQLQRHGLLDRFVCGAMLHETSRLTQWLQQASPERVRRLARRRVVKGVPRGRLMPRRLIEVGGWLATRLGLRGASVYRWRNELFQRSISRRALDAADVIVGYDTSSWLLAARARQLGRCFVLDQSIGHPRSLQGVLERICVTYPEWEARHERKTPVELELEGREHSLADLIAVPSRFVAATLVENGVPAEKLRVIPYGADTQFFQPREPLAVPAAAPTFLFAGQISARKGVPVLLDAWHRLAPRSARLVLAGPGRLPEAVRRTLPPTVSVRGALSREELRDAFHSADVFVFPSLFEGQAIVQLEAAACGLPIIATPSAGAEDIVEAGVNGLVVPAGDSVALAFALEGLIRAPHAVRAMQAAARARAATWGWNRYGDRWAALVAEIAR